MGSTVFPLEFISPSTYEEGRSLVCPGMRREERRKMLNLCSFLPSSLLPFFFLDRLALLYMLFKGVWIRFISTVYSSVQTTNVLQIIKRQTLKKRAGHCMWKFLFESHFTYHRKSLDLFTKGHQVFFCPSFCLFFPVLSGRWGGGV